jgi:hypothetical protein
VTLSGTAAIRRARLFDVLPDDTVLVSFPRSGNTWLRFLIGNLRSPGESVTFENVERLVPDIYVNTNDELMQVPRPRVLKSHETFDHRYPRVVYLVRNPADVAVSYYHYLRKVRSIDDDLPTDSYLEGFVAGDWGWWGSWREHVGSWIGAIGDHRRFLLVRYEDVAAEPEAELERIASFLGIETDRDAIARSVELSSLERMRKLEAAAAGTWVSIRNTRPDVPFVRGGRAGGGATELAPDSVALINSAWEPTLRMLGYAPEPQAAPPSATTTSR